MSEIKTEQTLINAIAQRGGISFAEYMQMALYEPDLGYYVNGSRKFGEQGDFVTAPQISSLFSQCIAKQCQQVLTMAGGDILEFGAGTGVMAADILLSLEVSDCLPDNYYIVEVSPDLCVTQRETLEAKCPHLLSKVSWLGVLPKDFKGVILANEVMDAMPVHIFQQASDGVYEKYVDENLSWQYRLANERLTQRVEKLELAEGYESEINFALEDWVQQLSNCLAQGVVLLIDYGFSQAEYYHPDRKQGTLMCHYQHRAHPDPLINIGLQDITAHVDFTAVAQAGFNAGLEVAGYATQANFLLSCGLMELINDRDQTQRFKQTQAVKKLVMPSEMGELFKVMALTEGFDEELVGFVGVDVRHKL